MYMKTPINSYDIILIGGVLDVNQHSSLSPHFHSRNSDYKLCPPPSKELQIFTYNKFAVLVSGNAVTQPGNTAMARPSHLVTR